MVPFTYVTPSRAPAARPLLLAPTPADLEDPSELLDLLDGVLITGGPDLDPARYGAEAASRDGSPPPPTATPSSSMLVRAAAERDLPCLGTAAASGGQRR